MYSQSRSIADKIRDNYPKNFVQLGNKIFLYAPSDGSNYFVNPPKPSRYAPKSLRSTAPDTGAEKAPETPQDASETSEGALAFSEGETLREDSAEGNE